MSGWNRAHRLLSLGLCLATLGAVGSPAHAADVVLRVGVQPFLNDIWAGVAANSFAKRGLKLEFQSFTSGATMFAALQGGAIDMGVGGMTTFYVARANGQEIRWVATTGNVGNSDACMLGPKSTVKSIADLKGKKIGLFFNTVVHAPLLEMLKANGVNADEVTLLNLQPPAATAALLNGEIEMACIWAPFVFQIADHGGRKLFTMFETPSGGLSYSGYAVTRRWMDANPEAMVAFLQGLREGQEAYAKDKGPAITAVSKATGLDPTLGLRLSQEIGVFPVEDAVVPDARVTMCNAAAGKGVGKILDNASKFFVSVGTLKQVLPFEEFLEPKFAATAFGRTCAVK